MRMKCLVMLITIWSTKNNIALRKPIKFPKDDDVRLLMDECRVILNFIDPFDCPSQLFVAVRSATATCLIVFCTRRGGEHVRLQLYQLWKALKGEWIDKDDLPDEFDEDAMHITYHTGKGSYHLVPVVFRHETIKGMHYLTNPEVPANLGLIKVIHTYLPIHKTERFMHMDDIASMIYLKGFH